MPELTEQQKDTVADAIADLLLDRLRLKQNPELAAERARAEEASRAAKAKRKKR